MSTSRAQYVSLKDAEQVYSYPEFQDLTARRPELLHRNRPCLSSLTAKVAFLALAPIGLLCKQGSHRRYKRKTSIFRYQKSARAW